MKTTKGKNAGRFAIVNIAMVLVCMVLAAEVFAGDTPVLKSEKEMVSYGIGVNVVRNFRQQGMDIDPDLVIRGMKDALAGGKLLMDEEVLRKAMVTYQVELKQKLQRARQSPVVQKKASAASETDARKNADSVGQPAKVDPQGK